MSGIKNDSEVALVFAEDLVTEFFEAYNVFYNPSTGGKRYVDLFRKNFNNDVLTVIYFFSLIPPKSCYETNCFTEGYNLLDFLHYCGRTALQSLEDFRKGNLSAGDDAILSIASRLTQFMSSGEFQRNGGWFELKEMCSKLCRWQVFCSVVCIGNKYVHSIESTENPQSVLQNTTPENS